MSSDIEVYSYSEDTFAVPERGEIRITDCPSSITDQLDRASFTQESPDVFTKSQQALDSTREYEVIEVTVDGDELHVAATDIIGIVSLTPSAKIQVNPKIDWEYIFDMLLAVYDQNRTIEYHGIPLQSFLSDGIDLDDVFVILAINYLQGLEQIHRNGVIRDLIIQRIDSLNRRGEIDIEQTLRNYIQGQIEPQWIRNEIEHDNAANSLLHYAGKTLLRLFQEKSKTTNHPGFDRIFSEVHREVRRLEQLGVTSSLNRMDAYRRLTLADLPQQRHYYQKALDVSKAIMSSSLGQQLRDGHRELVVDYVLNMESLFERYSQVVIERQFNRIRAYDHLDELSDVTPVRSPSVNPFEGEADIYHQPDHVLQRGDDTIAVLDSKYYAEGEDPVTKSPSRSRLFSYAYLLHADHLGFLCPLLAPKRRRVTQTDAELQVISPQDGFSLAGYDDALYDYLHGVLAENHPELAVFRAVSENKLSLDGVDESELNTAMSMDGPFTFKNPRNFSLRVVKAAADTYSWHHRNRSALEQGGDWTRDRVEGQCEQRDEYTTTCVPVFCIENGQEWIDLYFIDTENRTVEKEGPLKLL
jgi:5-methylcytosine-specific restriction endonuclease McrBC regulatory subunit McrC